MTLEVPSHPKWLEGWLGVGTGWFSSLLSHILGGRSWVSNSINLGPSFAICKWGQ